MVCYRRHGHNEGDDPSYTQPLMYKAIDERRSVRKLYVEALVKRGDITLEEAEAGARRLPAPAAGRARRDPPARAADAGQGGQAAARRSGVLPHVDDRRRPRRRSTRIFDHADRPTRRASRCTRSWPASSRPARSCSTRTARSTGRTAEALAFGSLLLEGTAVRLAGEDSRRGTFSQRHAVLVDYETGETWMPLADARPASRPSSGSTTRCCRSTPRSASSTATRSTQQGRARAVGGAVRRLRQRRPDHHRPVPRRRRGQVGPDLGPRAAAAPRLRGPGPRALARPASSASSRCAPRTTSRSCNATTAAQYFHLLRRQMRRDVRKPLVVFTPEVAAAHEGDAARRSTTSPRARSRRCSTTRASPIRPRSRRVVFCSGKVGLRRHRPSATSVGAPVAVVRVEQLFPFPQRADAGDARRATRTPRSSSGCRRSPRTWAPGTSSSTAPGGSRSRATTCATWPASSRAARPPARRRSTSRSWPT